MTDRIKTTVVGSYPVLSWLAGSTSRVILRDAVMVVLKTQELAGLDLITDGELSRFDPSHPETNGMVDYFVSQMEGIRKRFSMAELQRFYHDRALGSRGLPAGMVVSKVEAGTLNLAGDYEGVRALTSFPLKFTCTGPHMPPPCCPRSNPPVFARSFQGRFGAACRPSAFRPAPSYSFFRWHPDRTAVPLARRPSSSALTSSGD